MLKRFPLGAEIVSGQVWSLLDVLDLEAGAFLSAVTQLRGFIVALRQASADQAIADADRKLLSDQIGILVDEMNKVAARSAIIRAGRMGRALQDKGNPVTYGDVLSGMLDVESRFGDHVGDIKLFALNQNEATFLNSADLLLSSGDRSIEGFSLAYPNAAFEIEEASKCYVFNRFTASAFHAMRAMECGVRAISAFVGIPDPTKPAEKNWGIILKQINVAMDVKWPKNTRMPGTLGAKMESLYATLDAIKNPWRNATMHVETTYMPHEALHILRCVGMFLLNLSQHCDEEGRLPSQSPASATVVEEAASVEPIP